MNLGLKNIVSIAALGLTCSLTAGCGDRNPEITSPHRIRRGVDAPALHASESDRFGMRPAQAPAPKQPTSAAEFFDWTTPEGWEAQPSNQYRMVNMKVGEVECFLSNVAPGAAADNINRWRKQMGAEAFDAAQIKALKTGELLDREAYRMDVNGSYQGMTGGTLEDARMLTMIADFPQFALTLKMVGPRSEVEAQGDNFALFASSLIFSQDLVERLAAAEDSADDHTGHNHAPGEGHGAPSTKDSASQQGASEDAADSHAGHNHAPGEGHAEPGTLDGASPEGTNRPLARGQLAWQAPGGWSEGAPNPRRHVTFIPAADAAVECYISLLPGGLQSGSAGSLLDNLNRWQRQVGLGPIDAAGLAGLRRISLLGQQVPMLEALGESSAMLGTMISLEGEVLFVKLTGSPESVRSQRDNFITFCASVRND